MVNAGYHALDALRIEAGRRAWGAELGPDETPFEAGMGYAVKLDKPATFIGQAAPLKAHGQPPRKKLVTVAPDGPADYVWSDEALAIGGQTVGELSLAGWGFQAGRCVGLGYLRSAAAQAPHFGARLTVDLWGGPVSATAWDAWPSKRV